MTKVITVLIRSFPLLATIQVLNTFAGDGSLYHRLFIFYTALYSLVISKIRFLKWSKFR